MKKFLGILAFVISALSLILTILRVVNKKQETQNLTQHNNTITYGMREIENPFENEALRPEKQTGDVVIKIKDYKWYKMYKYELMSIFAMIVIVILVIILSSVYF